MTTHYLKHVDVAHHSVTEIFHIESSSYEVDNILQNIKLWDVTYSLLLPVSIQ